MPATQRLQGTFKQIPYWKLRGCFHSCGMRDKEVAQANGVVEGTLNRRMRGHAPWTSQEITSICELLDIPQEKIGEYFFPEVKSRKEIEDEES